MKLESRQYYSGSGFCLFDQLMLGAAMAWFYILGEQFKAEGGWQIPIGAV